jgi:hypothetical protein
MEVKTTTTTTIKYVFDISIFYFSANLAFIKSQFNDGSECPKKFPNKLRQYFGRFHREHEYRIELEKCYRKKLQKNVTEKLHETLIVIIHESRSGSSLLN